MAEVPPHDPVAGNHWLLLAEPQATADLRHDHFNAMLAPRGVEVAVVEMVRGWLSAADNWGSLTSLSIGASRSTCSLLEEWKAMGRALRKMLLKYQDLTLLAEELGQAPCRLNFATLDRMIVSAMEWQELESGEELSFE